ncbi:MAG: GldG family protein [Oscillospiraceae bacterium]|nr:GldG family protein [Oscillospiraceae bacterium]
MNNNVKKSNFKTGTLGIIFIVIVTACVVLLNVIFGMLENRNPMRLDFTKNKIFEISDQTKDFVTNLTTDVNIYVLSDEVSFVNNNDYLYQANEVIKSYATLSDKIKVTYIDTAKNPSFATKYPKLSLSQYDILVDGEYDDYVVDPNDLFNIEYSYNYYGGQEGKIASSKAEQTMTAAIMNVSTKNKAKVVFVKGHDEPDLEMMQALFPQNNYQVSNVTLATEEIPEDTSIVIITAPVRDFTEDELAKIDAYLDNNGNLGKNLIYLAHISQPELPLLNSFLEEWGIAVLEQGVYETSNTKIYSSTSPHIVAVDYSELDYSAEFLNSNVPFLSPNSVRFELAFTSKGAKTAKQLLNFSETAKAIDKTAEEYSNSDEDGPFPAAILCEELGTSGGKSTESRVVAFASAESFVDSIINSTIYSNGEYLMNLCNIISDNEVGLAIVPKQIEYSEINVSYAGAVAMAIGFSIVLPLIILIVGIVIWVRRRHR